MTDSIPVVFSTQPDPLLPQDSPLSPEDSHASDSPQAEPTLTQIWLAIQDCKASLTTQMETIHIDFSLLDQDVQTLTERTGTAEERISTLEDIVHPLYAIMHTATDELVTLKAKLFLQELFSRSSNLRFVGFPEHILRAPALKVSLFLAA